MSEPASTEPPRSDGRACRLVAFAIIATGLVYLGISVLQERPWVSDHTRIERCATLRHDRVQVLPSSDPDSRYSRDDLKTFCRIDAANDNLNHKGGIKFFVDR